MMVNETASYSFQKTVVDVQSNPIFNTVQPGVYWDGLNHVDDRPEHIASLVQNKVTYAVSIMDMYTMLQEPLSNTSPSETLHPFTSGS